MRDGVGVSGFISVTLLPLACQWAEQALRKLIGGRYRKVFEFGGPRVLEAANVPVRLSERLHRKQGQVRHAKYSAIASEISVALAFRLASNTRRIRVIYGVACQPPGVSPAR